jgi:hypothetical protein
MTVVWSFQCKAFRDNITSLAFHENSEMVGSLSQLDLESFKFSKIGIHSRSILVMKKRSKSL